VKRTPLPPRTKPLPRSTKRIIRKALIKNRGRSRFAKLRDPEYVSAFPDFPCLLTGMVTRVGDLHRCRGPIEPAHVKSRGAGGADRGNIVALCHAAHMEQHTIGLRSFEVKYFGTLGVLKHYAEDVYPHQVAARLALGWSA
jgi:hypothetical protein